MRKYLASLFLLFALPLLLGAQEKSLHQLQQEFVDLRFGMFVHFGLPTFQEADDLLTSLDGIIFSSRETVNGSCFLRPLWINVGRKAYLCTL